MALLPKSFPSVTSSTGKRISLWFERTVAILAALNFLLVLFDLSYIPLRDFWLQGRVKFLSLKVGDFEYSFPEDPVTVMSLPVTHWYDWVKGIEPYRDTDRYLDEFEILTENLISYNLYSPQVQQSLNILRSQSEDIIDTNPFQVANKTGTLERIKNLMRDHVETESAKEAFQTFWSLDYLEANNVSDQLDFFEQEIQPLVETNYFRPVGENGEPVDNFGILDFPFSSLFFVEFIARTWLISRRRKGVTWFDAMLWRWYDVLLFMPVPYWMNWARLLRIIPVTTRLNQAKLIDMHQIKKQASQGFVASIAEDLTKVVVVGILNQVQGSIKRGEFTNFLSQQNVNPYIDLNDTNEVAEITRLVVQLVVNQVLPAMRDDVEALVEYSINKAIADTPGAQGLASVPAIAEAQKKMTQQVVHNLYGVLYTQIQHLIEEDPEFDVLLDRIVSTFTHSMSSEITAQQSLERMEYLMTSLIEEIKVNYVQRLSAEDIEALMDQTRALRQVTQIN
ncbi:hypothetical protein PN441_16200 [Spirulina major CS-329]|uniref:hypothetical protein n=1 Tax=Spirulina TaxID=1154 RepID=UPI00232B8C78|nr:MULTISPECIES: hypothetical protein [Spirulina]MDB9493604.1 hypothetical protein [Spirulina subsalsa CS-330]MDB9504621.1 hypothetical protein [Spirulina major CS-329]